MVVTQFTSLILDPALQEINLYSENAKVLLISIYAHESNLGQYITQLNRGPAIGVFQMERETFVDLWNNFLEVKPLLKGMIMRSCNFKREPDADEMIYNLKFASQMARIFFLRVKKPLPSSNDLVAVSTYAKKYWNTEKGKATEEDYRESYLKYIGNPNA